MTQSAFDAGQSSYDNVRDAFNILAAGASGVAESLLDVAKNGKSEMARMYAAQAVLDRIGLPARVDVGLTATHLVGVVPTGTGAAVDTVKTRLAQLRQQQMQAEIETDVDEDGVVVQFPNMMIEGEVE